MNREEIADYLCKKNYCAKLYDEGNGLQVDAMIDGRPIRLTHRFLDVLTRLPKFYLEEADGFAALAHVERKSNSSRALICVSSLDSVSINYEVPHLVYEESLVRNLALLQRAITDNEWNRSELLREFRSNWDNLSSESGNDKTDLYFAAATN